MSGAPLHSLLWKLSFLFCGASNVWHTCWRVRDGPQFILGPSHVDFFWGPFYDAAGPYVDTAVINTVVAGWDMMLWAGVLSSGLIYWALGMFDIDGGFTKHPKVARLFAGMKLGVAGILLSIVAWGKPGPYTIIFGVAELLWSALLFARYRAVSKEIKRD